MTLKLRTSIQAERIVTNILAACKEIRDLNRGSYDFINIASGFIAHYNREGFIVHYQDYSLREDILRFQNHNQNYNYHKGQPDWEYYHQKAEIYNMICDGLKADTEFVFNSAVEAEYVRRGGVYCPKCGEYGVEGGQLEIDEGRALQNVGCSSCGACWIDVYVLTRISNFQE